MFTAQVNVIKTATSDKRVSEKPQTVRFAVSGDVTLSQLVTAAMEHLAALDGDFTVREITIRPLWWSSKYVSECARFITPGITAIVKNVEQG